METKYQSFIERAFEQRTRANPAYSLRSFARDLGLAPSSLSEMLNQRKGLSPKKARHVANALHLPEWQAEYFCDLVARDHAKSRAKREIAAQRLLSGASLNKTQLAQAEAMHALTSWLDLAILELTYLKTFKGNTGWIARRLGVAEIDVAKSAKRLQQVNLLEISTQGEWKDLSPLFTTTDGVPNESLRNFHRSVLNLAIEKLRSEDLKTRTVKTVVFSLTDDRLPAAQQILNEAIAKIVALADGAPARRDQVLCFSAQLFPLSNQETQ